MDVKFIQTSSSKLNSIEIKDGQIIALNDTAGLYYDFGGIRHSGSGYTLPSANSSTLGGVRLSDSFTQSAGTASAGVAASSYALVTAYNTLNSKITQSNKTIFLDGSNWSINPVSDLNTFYHGIGLFSVQAANLPPSADWWQVVATGGPGTVTQTARSLWDGHQYHRNCAGGNWSAWNLTVPSSLPQTIDNMQTLNTYFPSFPSHLYYTTANNNGIIYKMGNMVICYIEFASAYFVSGQPIATFDSSIAPKSDVQLFLRCARFTAGINVGTMTNSAYSFLNYPAFATSQGNIIQNFNSDGTSRAWYGTIFGMWKI